MKSILLVDDEPAVLDMLKACCEEEGYKTIAASDGKEAVRAFFQSPTDLVITDIRMPGMSGVELISRIREMSNVPIIVLSALGRESEKVEGLRAGADDYMVKPMGMAEMIARIEAVMRRSQHTNNRERAVYADGILTIHMERQEAYLRDQKLDLTPKELKLLVYLTQRADRVVPVQELLQGVWGSPHYSEESVKWHIASLRRKVEEIPHEPKLIVTVRGTGYRYDKPGTPATAPVGGAA